MNASNPGVPGQPPDLGPAASICAGARARVDDCDRVCALGVDARTGARPSRPCLRTCPAITAPQIRADADRNRKASAVARLTPVAVTMRNRMGSVANNTPLTKVSVIPMRRWRNMMLKALVCCCDTLLDSGREAQGRASEDTLELAKVRAGLMLSVPMGDVHSGVFLASKQVAVLGLGASSWCCGVPRFVPTLRLASRHPSVAVSRCLVLTLGHGASSLVPQCRFHADGRHVAPIHFTGESRVLRHFRRLPPCATHPGAGFKPFALRPRPHAQTIIGLKCAREDTREQRSWAQNGDDDCDVISPRAKGFALVKRLV